MLSIYDKGMHMVTNTWVRGISLEKPRYPEMKINDLQPWSIARIRAKWEHFYSILVPIFVIFVQIRGMDRVFMPNNQPVSSISDIRHGPRH